MLHTFYKVGLVAVVFGLLFVPGTAWAQDHRVRHIEDDAGLFNKASIEKANKVIDTIGERHHKDLFIQTVKEGPEKDRGDWARTRFNNYKLDGVYIVFSKKPHFFQVKVGDKTMSEKYFTQTNINELDKIIEKAPNVNEALVQAAEYVLETMNQHPAKKGAQQKRPQPAPPADGHRDAGESAVPSWVGWVCLIVGVLFVVWIIFAIIRSMTSMGGGYGYGGGGYGGGYGGGGGGFMTGMLGGLFGSMAGMWLYNNMFGGHATYGPNGNVNWGGDQGGAAAAEGYQGDTDTGGGGGGDYAGGDEAAGGGGDDAGGGGGGGDWGGGGGDAGGGGGGDWGGGGDAGGGGGGDWGGGGGGGDWGGGGGGGDFGGGGGGGGDW
jgi:TPM domain